MKVTSHARALCAAAQLRVQIRLLLSSAIFIVKGQRGVCRLAHSAIRGSWGKTHKFFLRSVAGARILRGVLSREPDDRRGPLSSGVGGANAAQAAQR